MIAVSFLSPWERAVQQPAGAGCPADSVHSGRPLPKGEARLQLIWLHSAFAFSQFCSSATIVLQPACRAIRRREFTGSVVARGTVTAPILIAPNSTNTH